MSRATTYNVFKLNAENEALHARMDTVLAKASLKTISREGKAVALDDATAMEKLDAMLAIASPGSEQTNLNTLTQTNAELAARLEKAESDGKTVNATVAGLNLEKQTLTKRAEDAEGAVQKLTAETAQSGVQLRAANSELVRVTKESQAVNRQISEQCLTYGCIDAALLKDADGKILAADADQDAKLAAADRIPVDQKLAMSQGAVNLSLQRITGVAPEPALSTCARTIVWCASSSTRHAR